MIGSASEDARGSVDLGGFFARVRSRWWIVALAFVIGGTFGYASGLASARVFEAKAVLYLPQQFTPAGRPIITLASQPSALSAIVQSDSTLLRVARQTGLSYATLRKNVSAAPLGGVPTFTTTSVLSPYFVIAVTGPRRRPVTAAARLLGQDLLDQVSIYSRTAIATLRSQLASLNAELARTAAAPAAAPGDPVAAALGQTLAAERNDLLQQRAGVRRQLASFTSPGRPRLASVSRATLSSAQTPKTSAIVAALVGLVVATLLAGLPLGRLSATAPVAARAPVVVRSAAGRWELLGVHERPSRRELSLFGLLVGSVVVILGAGLAAAGSLIGRWTLLLLLAVALAGLAACYLLGDGDT